MQKLFVVLGLPQVAKNGTPPKFFRDKAPVLTDASLGRGE
jgi:hypothetical protein